MKVIFEYEDGTYRIVPGLKAYSIEDRTQTHYLLNEYLFDNHIRRYIIADDNYIGGFKGHKDLIGTDKMIIFL